MYICVDVNFVYPCAEQFILLMICFLYSVRSSSSSSSSYRNNYGWKDSRPRPDQTNYNSSDKCDQNRLVNNSKSVKGGAVGGGSSLTLHKKKNLEWNIVLILLLYIILIQEIMPHIFMER